MNNWRLLLLAVVVVVQPFGSFTESNLFDGRECCERSEDARLYGYRKTDERRALDGNREDRRTAHEERRLRSDVRDERRYETYRGPMLTRSVSLERNERRFSPELSRSTEHRLVQEQGRHSRDTFARNREAHEDHNRNRDESWNILGQNERDSHEARNRDELDASRTFKLSRDGRDKRSVERESRNSMSRLPIRSLGSNEERRFTENRERSTLKRQNIAHSRRDSRLGVSARSESRLQRREREIKDSARLRQVSRIVTRREVRIPSEERKQQREVSRLSRDRTISEQRETHESKASRRNIRDRPEERRLQNNFSRDRVTMLRGKREVRDSKEGIQEARRIARFNVRSDLRRDVLDRSMERARMTSNKNDEQGNYARKLSRARSAPSRTREDTRDNGIERQQTRSQDRSMERATLSAATPRLQSRRSTRKETIRLERLVRNRNEARENDRQNMQRENRDGRILLNRQSSDTVKDSREVRIARNRDEVRGVRVLAERKQDSRETVKDLREARMVGNRDEVRSERVLAERRQDSSENLKDSREVRMARNRDEVRSERVLAERRQDSRDNLKDSREVRMARNRDEVRSERVLAERRQDSRENLKGSREVRMARNRDEVRSERVLAERRQDSRDNLKDSREVRMARNRDEVSSERVLDERRQASSETVRDLREARMVKNRNEVRSERVFPERRQDSRGSLEASRELRLARNRGEVRSERVLAERRQDNRDDARDSRNLREARNRDLSRSERTVRSVREKMAERSDSRQRDADSRPSQREAYVNNLNDRSRDFDARSTERQMNNLRTDIRGTKNDVRRNNDFIHERLTSERLERRESIRSVMNYQDAYVQEDEPDFSNWQMVFYTLQGVYLCGILVQMLNENANKKRRSFNWWSSAKNLIKVD